MLEKFERPSTKEVDEAVPEMVRMRKEGRTYKEIAQNLGFSTSTVWNRLKESDI